MRSFYGAGTGDMDLGLMFAGRNCCQIREAIKDPTSAARCTPGGRVAVVKEDEAHRCAVEEEVHRPCLIVCSRSQVVKV
eukprot:scaffold260565_cov32-Tisochrysis_lutea.AAC.4